jgi:hypothetical protein
MKTSSSQPMMGMNQILAKAHEEMNKFQILELQQMTAASSMADQSITIAQDEQKNTLNSIAESKSIAGVGAALAGIGAVCSCVSTKISGAGSGLAKWARILEPAVSAAKSTSEGVVGLKVAEDKKNTALEKSTVSQMSDGENDLMGDAKDSSEKAQSMLRSVNSMISNEKAAMGG